MEQIFIQNSKKLPYKAFDAELFRLRNLVELEATRDSVVQGDMYVCSLSSQTVTYKGQLTPEQLMGYFVDLQQEDFTSHMAMVHSRFSTNTFPSWSRAQPNRTMCHNGEINTLRGNRNWIQSRVGHMKSPLFDNSATSSDAVQSTQDEFVRQATMMEDLSDSGCFDKILELLSKASRRPLPECVMMLIPEAWQDNKSLSESKKDFYEFNSCVMEPWDGPAMIAFTDGRYVGANLDRNGLRPSRYYVTNDDVVLLSSEVGVVPSLPDCEVKTKARLEPGKMFLVDFDKGEIVSDNVIKEQVAASHPYAAWLNANLFSLGDWVASVKPAHVPEFAFVGTERKLGMFGYSAETLDLLLYPMGVGGKEALGSMGNDAALAVMSKQPRMLFDYFKQLFAQVECAIMLFVKFLISINELGFSLQVTNPPIDPIREEMVMSLQCPVGPEGNLLEVEPLHCARMVVQDPILSLQEMYAVKASTYR